MKIRPDEVMICNGMLTQIGVSFRPVKGKRVAVFKCSCGKNVITRVQHVRYGSISSCGCAGVESSRKRLTENKIAFKHGKKKSIEYTTWCSMRARCFNRENESYSNYGGRGIKVCDRWLDFELFLADMGSRPNGTSIDRIDNNGNYEPGNCRWADSKTQCNNTRSNLIIEIDGVQRNLKQWSDISGIGRCTIRARLLSKMGWSTKDAVFYPVRRRNKSV